MTGVIHFDVSLQPYVGGAWLQSSARSQPPNFFALFLLGLVTACHAWIRVVAAIVSAKLTVVDASHLLA
jgi:hypothetical protein